MKISFPARIRNDTYLKMIAPAMLLLLLGPGAVYAASGAKIEIQTIQIFPAEPVPGKHPEITGTIKANSRVIETTEVTVIASLVRPDNVIKSWTWKKIVITAGETKHFSIPKEYDVKREGVYKVDFGVYSKDMRPLNRLSKTFTVVDPSRRVKTTSQTPAVSTTASSAKASERSADVRHFGIGITGNAVNTGGGGTLFVWPFKYLGLQASYTVGTFTTAEGRLLARFPLSAGFNPYLGAGFMSVATERTVDTIGIKSTFTDSGVSGVIGVEIPFSRRVTGYVEVSGSSIELKKEVTDGVLTGTAKVKYSPVNAGFSIVYYLF